MSKLPNTTKKPTEIKTISLRISNELHKKIEDAKWKTRKSVNQLIIEVLEQKQW